MCFSFERSNLASTSYDHTLNFIFFQAWDNNLLGASGLCLFSYCFVDFWFFIKSFPGIFFCSYNIHEIVNIFNNLLIVLQCFTFSKHVSFEILFHSIIKWKPSLFSFVFLICILGIFILLFSHRNICKFLLLIRLHWQSIINH